MAKYIPTTCQICGFDLVLIQPAIKMGDNNRVARNECMQCHEEQAFTEWLNGEKEKKSNSS